MPMRTVRLPGGRQVTLTSELPTGCLIALMGALLVIVVISSAIGLRNEAQTRDQAAAATSTALVAVTTPTPARP